MYTNRENNKNKFPMKYNQFSRNKFPFSRLLKEKKKEKKFIEIHFL